MSSFLDRDILQCDWSYKSEIGVGLNLVGEKLKDFQISGLILSTSERNSPSSSNYEVLILHFREYLT